MKRLIFLFLLALPTLLRAQGEATMLFLLLPPSPSLNGMGAVGAALPGDDPFAFHFNPAQLGQTATGTFFSTHVYPGKVDWIPYFPIFSYNSFALNLGYGFKNSAGKTWLKYGAGYMSGGLDYNWSSIFGAQYKSKESYQAFGFAVGVNHGVEIDAGMTYKDIDYRLGYIPVGSGLEIPETDASAIDVGLLVNVPLAKAPPTSGEVTAAPPKYYPVLDLSLGYSLLNIGDEVSYIGGGQADPLPRTARFGYGIRTGVNTVLKNSQTLQLLGVEWAVEAEDILIERKEQGFEYQPIWGDINVWKNILLLEGSDKVITRVGMRFRLAELFSVSYGHFDGHGYENRETFGIGFSVKGLLKLWNASNGDAKLQWLAKHLDIQYYNANYFSGHEFETNFQGIIAAFHGF